MIEPIRIGIVGLGTVGSGVVRLLVESADHISRHAGRPIVVQKVVVQDVNKVRSVQVPGGDSRLTFATSRLIRRSP